MTRRRFTALAAVAVLLIGAVAITFAPLGRSDGDCGAWIAADPSRAVAANRREQLAFVDELIANAGPNELIAVALDPSDEQVRAACQDEYKMRSVLAIIAVLLSIGIGLWTLVFHSRPRST